MSGIRFTEDHEWIRLEEDQSGVAGITDYAQEQLGELVYVELPEVGQDVEQGNEAAVIESVKAAGELKAPVSGSVLEVNDVLADEPERVNHDPMGDGWFMRIQLSDPSELDGLMDDEEYQAYIAELD